VGLVERVDRFQRRHPAAGYPLAVAYKFFDDQGNYLTAMITYYAFLSVFPLLLLLISILGFTLHNDPDLQARVLDSALSRLPVIGQQIADNVQSLRGNTLAVVVGALGGVYGSLGVVQAAQNAFNKVWAVPRSSRPNPVMARLLSLSMLVALGIGLVVSTALSALSAVASQIGGSELGIGLRALLALAAVVLNVALLAFAFRLLTAQSAGTRRVLPGAVAAAVIWQLLQVLGTYYFGHTLRNSSATYGLFGVVLGLLVWLYLSAFAVVLGAEINSVLVRRLWPRSLLTPFTDDVQLTRGDRKAYASYAQTEQHKGFETVDVDFDQPGPDRSGRTADESRPLPDGSERTPDESRPAPDDSERAGGSDR
jgi:YihY family inner membrane protein